MSWRSIEVFAFKLSSLHPRPIVEVLERHALVGLEILLEEVLDVVDALQVVGMLLILLHVGKEGSVTIFAGEVDQIVVAHRFSRALFLLEQVRQEGACEGK